MATELEKVRRMAKRMRETAVLIVKKHAAIYAPDVSLTHLESICGALGDISINEAIEVLDRLQSEQAPGAGTDRRYE